LKKDVPGGSYECITANQPKNAARSSKYAKKYTSAENNFAKAEETRI
jgi:hypothetical protein